MCHAMHKLTRRALAISPGLAPPSYSVCSGGPRCAKLQHDCHSTTGRTAVNHGFCYSLRTRRRSVSALTRLQRIYECRHLERPRIITVKCRPSQVPSQGVCPQPLVTSHFVDGHAESIVLTQGLNGEPLRFPLHLWYSPTALSRSGPVNRAIYHITSGAAAKAWCGTVVVLKFNGSRRQGYSDAGSNDLPALSAYFLAYK